MMKNLRLSEVFNTTLSIFCSAVPSAVAYFIIHINEFSGTLENVILSIAPVVSIIIFPLLHHIFPRILPFVRPLHRYEGYWLQIIPNFERPFSIISFKFSCKHNGYYLCGTNFSKDFVTKVDFDANKFVETSYRNGFYYITNTTSEYRNGLGKISFINSHYDCLTRAKGYFFDASNESCSYKYQTELIKCDKKFFRHLGEEYEHLRARRLIPANIMKISEKFLVNELDNHKSNFSKIGKKQRRSCCKNMSND